MKIQTFGKLLFLASLLLWNACTKKAETSPAIIVNQDGKITAFGQAVELDNLQAVLMDSLLHLDIIPDTLSVEYQGEVLMGVRGEVRTQVNDAIAAAKEAQTHPVVVRRTFWQQQGADCDQPDTLRTNCAVINLTYPQVYYKETALPQSANAWVNQYLVGILTSGTEDEQAAANAQTLEAGAKVFFDVHESFKGSAMYGGFDAECKYDVLLNNGRYLTLQIESYTFQGGAHGSPGAIVTTFDTASGATLSWNDLVSDTTALKSLADQKFREVKAEAFEDGFHFDDMFPFKLADNYGLTDTGIYFYYVPYEVGPYVLGSTTFTIPFTELGGIAKIK